MRPSVLLLTSVCVAGIGLHAAGSEKVELPDGTAIQVVIEYPRGGTNGAPFCLVVPPGPGTQPMVDFAMRCLVTQFAARGWVTACPVSPDGKSFLGGNLERVTGLLDVLGKRFGVSGAKAVIAGISNGGIACLELAARMPDRFAAVVAVPGLASGQGGDLKDLPVFLRIGEKDPWAQSLPVTTNLLWKSGAKVDAATVAGKGHSFEPDWNELDGWLRKVLGDAHPKGQEAAPPPTDASQVPARGK